jgi:hypothetical protein
MKKCNFDRRSINASDNEQIILCKAERVEGKQK